MNELEKGFNRGFVAGMRFCRGILISSSIDNEIVEIISKEINKKD